MRPERLICLVKDVAMLISHKLCVSVRPLVDVLDAMYVFTELGGMLPTLTKVGEKPFLA